MLIFPNKYWISFEDLTPVLTLSIHYNSTYKKITEASFYCPVKLISNIQNFVEFRGCFNLCPCNSLLYYAIVYLFILSFEFVWNRVLLCSYIWSMLAPNPLCSLGWSHTCDPSVTGPSPKLREWITGVCHYAQLY